MNLRGLVDGFLGRRSAAAMPVPAELVERDAAIITLISIVYSTIPKTFDGPATFITVTAGQPVAKTTRKPGKPQPTTAAPAAATTTEPSSPSTTTSPLSSTTTPSSTTTQAPPTSSVVTPSAAAAAATSSAAASPTPTPSGGMSGGAKAGLAIGLLALFGLVIAGVIALYRRRKYQQENGQRLDDEKDFLSRGRNPNGLPPNPTPMAMANNIPAYNNQYVPPVAAAAPLAAMSPTNRSARFSYEEPQPMDTRATSQLDSGFRPQTNNATAPSERPDVNTGAVLGAAGVGAAAGAALAANHNRNHSQNVTSPNPSIGVNDPNNPFGNHAEKIATSPPQDIPLPPSPKAVNPQTDNAIAELPATEAAAGSPKSSNTKLPGEVSAVGAGAAIAAATAAAATSARPSQSPTPGSSPPGENVHRVQLDFVPSMDDELEVRAGGLVRILYEYDDGWALCMRMDRTQQGVVPRTCLSKLPVKPRPGSPNANRRGPPPPGMRGPPPNGRPGPPGGRPMTPTGRSAPYQTSPQQQGRARANSSSMAPYPPYAGAPRSQSPGLNGGGRLRPQDSTPNLRRRSNSMGGMIPQGNMSTSALPPSGSPTLDMPSKVPSRKPVPSQGSSNS